MICLPVVRTRPFSAVAVRLPRVLLPLAADLASLKIVRAGAARDRRARSRHTAVEVVPVGLGFAPVRSDSVAWTRSGDTGLGLGLGRRLPLGLP